MSRPYPDASATRQTPSIDIDREVVIGYEYDEEAGSTSIGAHSLIRSGTVIYADVEIGEHFQTGHRVTIREGTQVGDSVLIGTNSVVDGRVVIGSRVSIQTGVYLPPGTIIGDDVFIGPYVIMTNDPYPMRVDGELVGPTLENHVSVGANATLLPDTIIGQDSFIAAGAVVTDDVPPGTLAIGNPAEHRPLPDHLQGGNVIR